MPLYDMWPPVLGRRKRSYKQAMREQDEEQLEDEELQPPQNKTPSPPCPANKVSRFPPLLGVCHACSTLTLAWSAGGTAPPDFLAHSAEEPDAHDPHFGFPQQCHEVFY